MKLGKLGVRRLLLEGALAVPLATVIVGLGLRRAAGDGGIVAVADDEVAVIADLVSGEQRVVTSPGYHAFLPFFQDVHEFSRSPREHRMGGAPLAGAVPAPPLVVRADDGSSFWFDELSLRYALLPEHATTLVDDGGVDPARAARLVGVHARAVLADELGRRSAEEIVLPDHLHAATRAATERLGALLRPHGIAVLEIATKKPRFDPAYETAIERRKVADQTVLQLAAKRAQLQGERLQREARTRKEKELERRDVESALDRERLEAERNAIRVRTEADIFHQEHLARGLAIARERGRKAAAARERSAAEAAALEARLAGVEAQGRTAVREALIQRLASIRLDLVSY
jgi:hypothetical protein